MVANELIDILRCPESGQTLCLAEASQIDALNVKIRGGELRSRDGRTLEAELDAGLIREDGKVLYPILDDIPILLMEESVPLAEDLPALESDGA